MDTHMLPLSSYKEKAHRKNKRQLEITIIIDEVLKVINRAGAVEKENINILEFGSGNGFQLPYLKKIGNVIASDIYETDEMKK